MTAPFRAVQRLESQLQQMQAQGAEPSTKASAAGRLRAGNRSRGFHRHTHHLPPGQAFLPNQAPSGRSRALGFAWITAPDRASAAWFTAGNFGQLHATLLTTLIQAPTGSHLLRAPDGPRGSRLHVGLARQGRSRKAWPR